MPLYSTTLKNTKKSELYSLTRGWLSFSSLISRPFLKFPLAYTHCFSFEHVRPRSETHPNTYNRGFNHGFMNLSSFRSSPEGGKNSFCPGFSLRTECRWMQAKYQRSLLEGTKDLVTFSMFRSKEVFLSAHTSHSESRRGLFHQKKPLPTVEAGIESLSSFCIKPGTISRPVWRPIYWFLFCFFGCRMGERESENSTLHIWPPRPPEQSAENIRANTHLNSMYARDAEHFFGASCECYVLKRYKYLIGTSS